MAKKWLALADFIGERDEVVLDPKQIDFTSKAWANGCRTCLFSGQYAAVCNKANELAIKAGLRGCEAGFIYVRRVRDQRQLTIGE